MPTFAYAKFFEFKSRHIREHIQRERERREKIKLAQDKEESENRAYWQARIGKMPSYRADKHPLIAIPRNSRRLANLPERRKRAFRDNLNWLISSVFASPNTIYTGKIQPNAPHEATKLLSGACALCAGACCLHGGEHAYLSELTLIRVIEAQPSLRPRHILDLYLSHVGNRTYENACVYQGKMGCALPLELRSTVCLDYFCPSLKNLKEVFDEGHKPEGAFAIVRAREHWDFPNGEDNGIAGAFLLTENGVEKLD